MILRDNRIFMRSPEPQDVDFLYNLENNTEIWAVSTNMEPYSRTQIETYIKENPHDLFTYRQVRFVICRTQDSAPVGTADLTDIDFMHRRAEIGLAILDKFRGNGFSASALTLLEEYAQKNLQLNSLHAIMLADNNICANLFISHGYTLSGTLKEWIWNSGRYSDAHIYQKILKKNI